MQLSMKLFCLEDFPTIRIIASKFAEQFSKSYSCNYAQQSKTLSEEYIKESYSGLPLPNDIKCDTELVKLLVNVAYIG